ncbi:3-deoxy-manno-octulosonate cytidylyltransferase [Sphingomonas morindae]|uniref:3-deoxy-manno-octulosonate cytidylyltransferase n=1 Tax=Sphingomonas morindae TaxID=1541170 RepID=A0ABY4X632_9SPHN|nr:3-deoxy-manno-octulosonate cytidylyltransferase [Sphingomonas morindae]USI72374.1 3-deoxy-manno-octulosonate cytidylyltransferase [Sphingomonas morindae]
MARDLIVIPARYGSTRLPGKPLIEIAGHTLLARVVHVARRAAALAGAAELLVATDDRRIADHAEALGCTAVMTDTAITTGSGRAHAAAQASGGAWGALVNLQGDAPFTPPAMIAELLAALRGAAEPVATPIVRLDWDALSALRAHKRAAPFSGTTCIRGEDGRALWFSKAIIPAIRDEARLRLAGGLSPVCQHVGLYAYRPEALARFEATPPSPYERLEGLEQLRFLEMGVPIRAVEVAPPPFAATGVDTIEDVRLAEALIARHGDPLAA